MITLKKPTTYLPTNINFFFLVKLCKTKFKIRFRIRWTTLKGNNWYKSHFMILSEIDYNFSNFLDKKGGYVLQLSNKLYHPYKNNYYEMKHCWVLIFFLLNFVLIHSRESNEWVAKIHVCQLIFCKWFPYYWISCCLRCIDVNPTTVSGVFQDLNFKISEGLDQNRSCPESALWLSQFSWDSQQGRLRTTSVLVNLLKW